MPQEVPTEGMAGPSTLTGPLKGRGTHLAEMEQAPTLADTGPRKLWGEDPLVTNTSSQPRTFAAAETGTSACSVTTVFQRVAFNFVLFA